MKRIIPVLLLFVGGFTLASCGNSAPQHSKAYNAGVAWVRNDFPGYDDSICMFSVLVTGANCAKAQNFCASNAALDAEANDNDLSNYNMQQWIDGCVSVSFKHWPKWYRNSNNG